MARHPARNTDPSTSHDAARSHVESGAQAAQQRLVTTAVHSYPGLTSMELAKRTTMDRYVIARRLPECEDTGNVRRGQARMCGVSKRLALTWWPAGAIEQPSLFPGKAA